MAKNTKKGSRNGQVSNRFQFYNPKTKLWCKYNTETNKIMATKAIKFKGVREKKKNLQNNLLYKKIV